MDIFNIGDAVTHRRDTSCANLDAVRGGDMDKEYMANLASATMRADQFGIFNTVPCRQALGCLTVSHDVIGYFNDQRVPTILNFFT